MADCPCFGSLVRRFLLEEIVADRNLSRNTQRSYRDTIGLLVRYMADHHATEPTQLSVEAITPQIVRDFLAYLEHDRGNCIATRNQRLAAIRSLFGFAARIAPELIELAGQVQSIPIRRAPSPTMDYLEKHEMDALLAAADQERPQGRRDYALLLFLYNTGTRASEAANVSVTDLDLGPVPSVRILGKGCKSRLCPLWPHTVETLRKLLATRIHAPDQTRVFLNVCGQPITRFGIHTLVERIVEVAARSVDSLHCKSISPHTIRHTTAVHLLRAGVDINTIRAWLGHSSLETTNRYAQIDLEMKAKALEQCAISTSDSPPGEPVWRNDSELMAFLRAL